MASLLHEYKNGNANVKIYTDGTRVIETEDDDFFFDTALNCDIKITNYCTKGCAFCHENSNQSGKHAPMSNFDFVESWQPGCEAALGGGMVTTHPQFEEILNRFKRQGVIANVTVHQDELIDNFEQIKKYQSLGLIHGIGVSLINPTQELATCVNNLCNVVFHVINGIFTEKHYQWILSNIQKPKILILGYKHFRRGNDYYDVASKSIVKQQEWLHKILEEVCHKMSVVSFDNLAIKQLDVKRLLTEAEWDEFYQGDEATSSFYIDAVEGLFAPNSTSNNRMPIVNNVPEMFQKAKELYKEEQSWDKSLEN